MESYWNRALPFGTKQPFLRGGAHVGWPDVSGALPWLKGTAESLYGRARARPAVVVLAGTTFFIFALSTFIFSFPTQRATATAPAAASAQSAAEGDVRPLEMHIAANGLVLLRSAKVVSLGGSTLTVSTAWGESDFIWTVRTDAYSYESRTFGTRFLHRDGTKASLNEFHIGDSVTVTGMLDPEASEPVINADSVRLLKH